MRLSLQTDGQTPAREPGAGTKAGVSGRSSELQQRPAGTTLVRVSDFEPAAGGGSVRREAAGTPEKRGIRHVVPAVNPAEPSKPESKTLKVTFSHECLTCSTTGERGKNSGCFSRGGPSD